MGIRFSHRGDFKKTEKRLKKTLGRNYMKVLDRYAKLGVQKLIDNTPMDTGRTAASWSYEIIQNERAGNISIVWKNDNFNDWVNIALLIQYDHATGNGGYVQGVDYINPALKPVFQQLADAAWKEVIQ